MPKNFNMTIPKRLPLLVLKNDVLFPGSSIRIPVTSQSNMDMIRSHVLDKNTLGSTIIGVVPQEQQAENTLNCEPFHSIGTAGVVVQVTGTNWPQPSYTVLVTGLCRFRLNSLLQEKPFPVAMVTPLDQFEEFSEISNGSNSEIVETFRNRAFELVEMLDTSAPLIAKIKGMLNSIPSHKLADICAALVKASFNEKLSVLDATQLEEKFKKTLPLLIRQIEDLRFLQRAKKSNSNVIIKPLIVKSRIHKLPPDDFSNEDNDEIDDITDLESKLRAAKMPDQAHKVSMKELQRLKKMTPQMPEHALTRNYLELMSELPWSKSSTETLDINKSRNDLDADHYAMEKLKKRVLEYLAVRRLKNSLKGPILCFVGPPGVGKTSVGKSIAKTLGREFNRLSLGGVCDQSDIRGHRRTYIGAMPGRIIQGLRTAGVNNPVFLLDEIDKMSSGVHGDPAAALLEVLDPEQNYTFTDHYVNVPFDLSQILFIATANSIKTIPAALLDRMEVIHVSGYTHEEKLHIATRHLIPKQFEEHGLIQNTVQIRELAVKFVVDKYTRESGVRNLERKIGAVCRAVAVKVAEMTTESDDKIPRFEESNWHPPAFPIILDETAIEDILGPPLYESEIAGRLGQPGIAVGLAWTPLGGEIMFVEATKMEGDGRLILTGQLGDVMKESARLALNWIRTHAQQYNIRVVKGEDLMENKDVHVHFPAGAIGKDGPSAGITILCALVSLFTNRCVASDVALTGEITLRGVVLAVGGVKEKVIAAHRAGIRRIILPKRNEKDLQEIPSSIKCDLDFVFATHVDDALVAAFGDKFPVLAGDKHKHNDENIPSKL